MPRVLTFKQKYVEPIFVKKNPAIILFTDDKDKDYHYVFAQAAKELQGQILFVTTDIYNELTHSLADLMKVEKFMMPALRILDPNEGKLKFIYDGNVKDMTVADIQKFISDFKAGNIKPWF